MPQSILLTTDTKPFFYRSYSKGLFNKPVQNIPYWKRLERDQFIPTVPESGVRKAQSAAFFGTSQPEPVLKTASPEQEALNQQFQTSQIQPDPVPANRQAEFNNRVALLMNNQQCRVPEQILLNAGQVSLSGSQLQKLMIKALSKAFVTERLNYFEGIDSRDYWGAAAILAGRKNGEPVYRLIFTSNHYMRNEVTEKNEAHCAEREAIKMARQTAYQEALENPQLIFLMNMSQQVDQFPEKTLTTPTFDITPCGTCQDDILHLVHRHQQKTASSDNTLQNTLSMPPSAAITFVRRHQDGQNRPAPLELRPIQVQDMFGPIRKGVFQPVRSFILPSRFLKTTLNKNTPFVYSPGAQAAKQHLTEQLVETYGGAHQRTMETQFETSLRKMFQEAHHAYYKHLEDSDTRAIFKVAFHMPIHQLDKTQNKLYFLPRLFIGKSLKSRYTLDAGVMAGITKVDLRNLLSILYISRLIKNGSFKQFLKHFTAIKDAATLYQESHLVALPVVGFYSQSHVYDAHELEMIANKQAPGNGKNVMVATLRDIDGEPSIYLETIAEIYPYLYISAGKKKAPETQS